MSGAEMYPFRVFGVVATTLFMLCGWAVLLRPTRKIKDPGHRVGNFIIWMLGERWGMAAIRISGLAMVLGGGFGLIAALVALTGSN